MKGFVTFFAFLLLLALPQAAIAFTKAETTRETIVFQKKTRSYFLFVPEKHQSREIRPVSSFASWLRRGWSGDD